MSLSEIRRSRTTHRDPVGHEIAFVDDQDDLLVRFLLLDVLEDGFAHGTEGIASVEDVEDDIGRVDDFVQLTVDPTRRPFGVDRLVVVGVRSGFGEG